MPLLNEATSKVVLALLASPRTGTYLQADLGLSGERLSAVARELHAGGFLAVRDSKREPYTLTRAGEELASLFVQFRLLTGAQA